MFVPRKVSLQERFYSPNTLHV